MKATCETKEKLLGTMIALIWESSYGSVSVDDICRRAGVKKGSFYHFFPSKADLAVAAMEHHWQEREVRLNQTFSVQLAPWARFERLGREIIQSQTEARSRCGKVLGCPFFTIGAEMSTQDEKLRQQAGRMNAHYLLFYESAIRDGMASGEMAPGDPVAKARQAFAFVSGLLLQAKVLNDILPLHDLEPGLRSLLGVQTRLRQAA